MLGEQKLTVRPLRRGRSSRSRCGGIRPRTDKRTLAEYSSWGRRAERYEFNQCGGEEAWRFLKAKEQRRIEPGYASPAEGFSRSKDRSRIWKRTSKAIWKKARRAKQMGSNDQLALLRQAIKRAIASRMMLERQLLNIETRFSR